MRSLDRYFQDRRSPEWGWFRVGDVNVCVPKKNGSTSFRFGLMPNTPMAEFLKRYRPMTNEQAEVSGLPCYLAVRDPVQRFTSLWRTVQRSTDFRSLRGISPGELLELVADRLHDDAHWQPQSDYLIQGAEVVPYQEMLARIGLPSTWAQRSTGRVPAVPTGRVLALYARDAEIAGQV